ncbi:MAG: hypothetical protein L0K86_23345 [Actinomycetia bacterium]|nr:hypothetical protein [Actinomycetes bacterium]
MARRRTSEVPSPLLPVADVEHLLVEGIADLGALGGGLGGALGGGLPGRVGGASGGRTGGRFGARHLTRLDGDQLTVRVERSAGNLHTVRTGFFGGRAQESVGTPPGTNADAVLMIGAIGAGAMSMNLCVVQLVWFARELHATAHAKEGLIKQRTCAKALQTLTTTLGLTG